jgi:hypothetical protein
LDGSTVRADLDLAALLVDSLADPGASQIIHLGSAQLPEELLPIGLL